MSDADFLKRMGQRILARRRALGMTQEDLADQIQTTAPMISNLELGKKAVRPDNLAKVCKALGLSADFVLTGADTQTPIDIVADKLLQLSPAEVEVVNDMIDIMLSKK